MICKKFSGEVYPGLNTRIPTTPRDPNMLRNNLIIAWRHLLRHQLYSVISISGLAIGMACCILIGLYVQHELSYDQFHENAHRIYRLVSPVTPIQFEPLAPLLTEELPEVEKPVRIARGGRPWLSYGDKQFPHAVYVPDEGFFELFDFPFVYGNRQTALDKPYAMVISTDMAEVYFGEEDPIGKMLRWDTSHEYEVTGVFARPPNTHFPFHFLASLKTVTVEKAWGPRALGSWGGRWTYIYLLLSEGYEVEDFSTKVLDVIERHGGAELRQQLEREGQIPYLQPLTDIHLHSHFKNELQPGGDLKQLYMLAGIAFFVLVIACINFANLATARANTRAREVGIRKVVGSTRRQLAVQFLGESVMQAFFALLPAWLLAELALPAFNAYAGVELSLDWSTLSLVLPTLCGVTLCTGVLAGVYPALLLSSFRPAQTLKGKLGASGRGAIFRKGLVVFQFSLSIFLIVATALVYSQLGFMRAKKLGFDREQIIAFQTRYPGMQEKAGIVKEVFAQVPGVKAVSRFRHIPSERYWDWMDSDIRLLDQPVGAGVSGSELGVDAAFVDLMGLEMLAGSGFVEEMGGDNAILNETAARLLGFDLLQEALGQRVHLPSLVDGQGIVRGVVADFNFESLHHPVGPIALYNEQRKNNFRFIGVRMEAHDVTGTLARLEEAWRQVVPEYPFYYEFHDEKFTQLYRKEERLGSLLSTFSLLAIFVACMGIFALAAFTTEQRTKEIGVRKVLGATGTQIVLLLSKELTWLVIGANIIAWPVAYWAAQYWLADFAYRIDLRPGLFALSGGLVLLVAWLTVGGQALKAALKNPVDALRCE